MDNCNELQTFSITYGDFAIGGDLSAASPQTDPVIGWIPTERSAADSVHPGGIL
jgi:hypothetical protein